MPVLVERIRVVHEVVAHHGTGRDPEQINPGEVGQVAVADVVDFVVLDGVVGSSRNRKDNASLLIS